MEEIRLQKYFTDCGILSRRAAEKAIADGRVTVNRTTAVIGQKIIPGQDIVALDGKDIRPPRQKAHTYLMLNKPRGYLTTLSDERGRACIPDLLTSLPVRVYPVGRLDRNSDGLLILTDDGDLANRLTHPRHDIPKRYHVIVRGRPTDDQLNTLRAPLVLDGYRIRPVKTEVLSADDSATTLEMTLFEGRNRQIRKMCEIAGLKIVSLTRVAVGAVLLGSLPVGKWRHLTETEVAYLKQSAPHT